MSVVVGSLYIFVSRRKTIEVESERFLKQYTLTQEFHDKIHKMVDKTIDECLDDTSIEALNSKISALENDIESIKSQVTQNDNNQIIQEEVNTEEVEE